MELKLPWKSHKTKPNRSEVDYYNISDANGEAVVHLVSKEIADHIIRAVNAEEAHRNLMESVNRALRNQAFVPRVYEDLNAFSDASKKSLRIEGRGE